MTRAARSVYVARSEFGLCKIGISYSPDDRVRDVGRMRREPIELIWASRFIEHASQVEKQAHLKLIDRRVEHEWFRVDTDRAIDVVVAELEDYEAKEPERVRRALDWEARGEEARRRMKVENSVHLRLSDLEKLELDELVASGFAEDPKAVFMRAFREAIAREAKARRK